MKLTQSILLLILSALISLAFSFFIVLFGFKIFYPNPGFEGILFILFFSVLFFSGGIYLITFCISTIVLYFVLRTIPVLKKLPAVMGAICLVLIIYGSLFYLQYSRDKQEKTKIQAQVDKKQTMYNTFKSQGYFPPPTYLPPTVFEKPLEEHTTANDIYTDTVSPSIEYSCKSPGDRLFIKYHPLEHFPERRVLEEYDLVENYPFMKNLLQTGGMTFEKVLINGKQGYYEKFNTSPPYGNTVLVWETEKSTIMMSLYGKCNLTKEELIRIAESMR